jgi:hypothetical protein
MASAGGRISMKRIVSALVCVLTLCFQGHALAQSLNGTWRGTGHQSPAGGAGADWSIAMTINANASSIDYPSLKCGGTLAQLSRTDSSAEFREHITYGQERCVDGGTITVKYLNGQLGWSWFGSQGGKQYTAIAVLSR